MGLTFNLGRDSAALTSDASLNVGIGAAPSGSYKLEVTGTGRFSSRINGVVGGTLYNTAGLWLQGSSATDGISIGGTAGGDKNIDTYGGTLKINSTSGNGLSITGNVGIGTSSPTSNLQIQSTSYCEVRSFSTSTGDYANFITDTDNNTNYRGQLVSFGSTAAGTLLGNNRAAGTFLVKSGGILGVGTRDTQALVFGTNETERMRITSGGSVLMNTTSVLSAGWLCISVASNDYNAIVLRDTGTTYSSGNYYQIFTNSSNGLAGGITHPTATTVGFYTGPSDQRLKSNIKDVEEPVLPLFNNAKLKTYNHIADEDESVVYKGFLAQDMVDNFPEAYGKDKEGYYMYNPTGYIPYLVKAIQESHQLIKDLESRIVTLENK